MTSRPARLFGAMRKNLSPSARSRSSGSGPCATSVPAGSAPPSARYLGDRDLHADCVHVEPAQGRLGGGETEALLAEAGHGAVVEQLALVVAPARVVDLPDGELGDVAREIRSSRRAASGPSIRYFMSGETSIRAAASRIAQYSRSMPRS